MMVLAGSAEGPPQNSTPYFDDVTDSTSPYFNFIQVAFEKAYLVQCNPGQLPRLFCPTNVPNRRPFADDVARTMVAEALSQVPAP